MVDVPVTPGRRGRRHMRGPMGSGTRVRHLVAAGVPGLAGPAVVVAAVVAAAVAAVAIGVPGTLRPTPALRGVVTATRIVAVRERGGGQGEEDEGEGGEGEGAVHGNLGAAHRDDRWTAQGPAAFEPRGTGAGIAALVDPLLPLLREDGAWLAVDKPPGLPVVPGRRDHPQACVRRLLEIRRKEPLWVVHRLDRDTSGVLLLARTPAAHRTLCMAFEAGAVEKTYLALVRGEPPAPEGVVDVPLHAARKGKTRPARPGEPGARPAATVWRVLRRWDRPAGAVCLVEARPRTGRTHQVRVHLRYLGCPLALDPLYGGAARDLALVRTPLHAAILVFSDPTAGTRVRLESPLPADLASAIGSLEAERPPGDGGARTVSDLPPGAGGGWPG